MFKVGDTVRRVKNFKGFPITNSRVLGVVVEVDPRTGSVRVRWMPRNCSYWLFNVDRLELVGGNSPIAG